MNSIEPQVLFVLHDTNTNLYYSVLDNNRKTKNHKNLTDLLNNLEFEDFEFTYCDFEDNKRLSEIDIRERETIIHIVKLPSLKSIIKSSLPKLSIYFVKNDLGYDVVLKKNGIIQISTSSSESIQGAYQRLEDGNIMNKKEVTDDYFNRYFSKDLIVGEVMNVFSPSSIKTLYPELFL